MITNCKDVEPRFRTEQHVSLQNYLWKLQMLHL